MTVFGYIFLALLVCAGVWMLGVILNAEHYHKGVFRQEDDE